MAVYDESTGFCRVCNKQSLLRRRGTNHILHLLLTIVTFGWWSLAWLSFSLKLGGGWRCGQCGAKARVKRGMRETVLLSILALMLVFISLVMLGVI
jgi:hypothetical protein